MRRMTASLLFISAAFLLIIGLLGLPGDLRVTQSQRALVDARIEQDPDFRLVAFEHAADVSDQVSNHPMMRKGWSEILVFVASQPRSDAASHAQAIRAAQRYIENVPAHPSGWLLLSFAYLDQWKAQRREALDTKRAQNAAVDRAQQDGPFQTTARDAVDQTSSSQIAAQNSATQNIATQNSDTQALPDQDIAAQDVSNDMLGVAPGQARGAEPAAAILTPEQIAQVNAALKPVLEKSIAAFKMSVAQGRYEQSTMPFQIAYCTEVSTAALTELLETCTSQVDRYAEVNPNAVNRLMRRLGIS